MQGDSFKQFWKDRGFSLEEVKGWTVDLDKDIHRAITESGWWDREMFETIALREKIAGGLLGKDEVVQIAQELLDQIAGWGK